MENGRPALGSYIKMFTRQTLVSLHVSARHGCHDHGVRDVSKHVGDLLTSDESGACTGGFIN